MTMQTIEVAANCLRTFAVCPHAPHCSTIALGTIADLERRLAASEASRFVHEKANLDYAVKLTDADLAIKAAHNEIVVQQEAISNLTNRALRGEELARSGAQGDARPYAELLTAAEARVKELEAEVKNCVCRDWTDAELDNHPMIHAAYAKGLAAREAVLAWSAGRIRGLPLEPEK